MTFESKIASTTKRQVKYLYFFIVKTSRIYFFLRIRIIPNIISSINKVISIPVPFKVIIDDSLIWLTDDGCIIVNIPNIIRPIALMKQR